jgi:ParB-like chromosome segregation protein Spo0J
MTLSFAPECIEQGPLARLQPYARNAKTHGADQVAKIAASMAEFGWTVPCLVAEDGELIAGHGRVLAATQLGLTEAPVIVLGHLTEAQRRAYRIADNRLTESPWDEALLSAELNDLLAEDFDLSLVGFSDGELDKLLAYVPEVEGEEGGGANVPPVVIREPPRNPASRTGDRWILGDHRLLCGDSHSRGADDRNAATEAQVEPDGAVAPDKISERLAFGQAVGGAFSHGGGPFRLEGVGVDFDPSLVLPDVKVAKLAGRAWKHFRRVLRVETVQFIGAHLSDLTRGENVLGRPARERGQHVCGISIMMDVDMRPFLGAGLDGDLRARAHSALRQISCRSASTALAAASCAVGRSILRFENRSEQSARTPASFSAASMLAATLFRWLRSRWSGSVAMSMRIVVVAMVRSFQQEVAAASMALAPAMRPASKASSRAARIAQTATSWKSSLSLFRVSSVSTKKCLVAISRISVSGAAGLALVSMVVIWSPIRGDFLFRESLLRRV